MENATCDYNVQYNVYVPKGKRWRKIGFVRDTDKYDDICKYIDTLIMTTPRFKIMVGRNPIVHFNKNRIYTLSCVDCYNALKIITCNSVNCCIAANICRNRSYEPRSIRELREVCKL